MYNKNKYNVFADDKAFSSSLVLAAFNLLGGDLFTFELDTIKEEIQEVYGKVAPKNWDRLFAGVSLYTSNSFWYDAVIFGITCRTLNRAQYLESEAPTLADICWGMTEASLILDTGAESKEKYSDAVESYVQVLLDRAGITTPLNSIPFVYDNTYYEDIQDDVQALAKYQESLSLSNSYDTFVDTQMLECLTQISKLDLPLSQEASTVISDILKGVPRNG